MQNNTFESLSKQGFVVTDCRQYYESDDEKRPMLEMHMHTPYYYDGYPVDGYAVVPCWNDRPREANTVEFYQNKRNLEDVWSASGHTGELVLQTKSGEDITEQDASREMASFAEAASEYPHVFTYDEYVSARTPINKRLHLDAPSESDYEAYLESVQKQMVSEDVKFVGSITNARDVCDMYHTMPSVRMSFVECFHDDVDYDGVDKDWMEGMDMMDL